MLNTHETHNSHKKFVANTLSGIATNQHLPFNKNQRDKTMININSSNGNKKLCAKFKLTKNNHESIFKLCGQESKSLIALITEKEKGITALEVSSWALRLSSYIHRLRSRYNLSISTVREPHQFGHHGRYFLHDDVEILEVNNLYDGGLDG